MRGLTQATISSLFLLPLVLATRYTVIYEEDDQLATPTDQPNLLNLLGGSDPLPPYEGVIENTVYVPPHLVGRAGCDYCNASSSTPACCVSGAGVQYCCSDVAICTTAGWCCPFGGQACPNGPRGACASEGETCCGRTVCRGGQTCCGRICCGSNQVCSDGYCLPRSTSSTSTSSTTTTTTTTSTSTSTSSSSTSTSTSSTSVSSDTDSSSSTSLPQDPSTPNETSTSTPIDEPPTPSPSVNDPSTPVNDPSTSVNDPSPTVDDPPPTVDDPTPTVSDPTPSVDDPSIPPSDTIPPTQPVDPPTNSIDAVPSDTIVDSSAVIQGTPPVDPPASSDTGPASSSVPTSDSPQVLPFVATADVSSTANVPIDSPVVTQETIVSSGSTLTVSRTVLPHAVLPSSSSSATAANDASLSGSDAVAYVYPWDPRIQYDPEDAWVSTSSSSSVGNCHNGTKVSSTPGSSIKFGFEGKQIALLICNGSKGGNYTVQVDGSPASTYSSWKDPTVSGSGGDECIISQPFTSNVLQDGQHNITVIVKGSLAGTTTQQGQVEFGGFIYRGPHAVGTRNDSKPNLPAIIGGAVGGVIGGVAIITLVVVLIILRRRRRNQRVDNSSAVDNLPPAPPTFTSAPTYTPVPMSEYHDPYANSGYGPQYYPNPTGQTAAAAGPSWRQTDEGPFGPGSYASPGVVPPSMQAGYAR